MNQPDTSTLEGKIAVMQAAKDGKRIQARLRGRVSWDDTGTPIWDWGCFDYRISPIAAGHNPDGLTEEQVPQGRRLMTEEEVARGKTKSRSPIGQIWWWRHGGWDEGRYYMDGNATCCTYCVPIDWVDPLLPKPTTTIPWSSPDDVPGPVPLWMRPIESTTKHLCVCVSDRGLVIGSHGFVKWDGLVLWEYYSTDRKTWKPCEKENGGQK